MYARSIVDARLGLAFERLKFLPEYHSVAEVQDFANRLERKYADAYAAANAAAQGSKEPTLVFQNTLTKLLCNPVSPRLSSDEARWIENERALVQCDASYFLTRYYWIKTPLAIQRFTFLPGQEIYFNVISELEDMRAAIEMIIAKARQHGISTETEGLTLHRACFGYGVNCVVASADQGKTGKMAQMTFLGYDMLPWWLRPVYSRRVESDHGMLVFGTLKSGISFQHGSQTSGIARGDTVKVYHLSEASSYTNPQEQIEASLFRCVHPHPDVFGVIESSAEGDTGWFNDTYWHAKAEWKNRRARLCPLFLPWFLGIDKYPTETWIRTRPVPVNWRMEPETRKMIQRAKAYIASNPVLERVLGAGWEMPRNQAWYWEVNFLEHRAKGLEKLWFQEMPTDDREAFQSSYDNVFGREVIAEVDTRRESRYHVYGIIGQSIETRHEPDPEELDPKGEMIPVRYRSRRGVTYSWELVPLQWTEPFQELSDLREDDSHMGKLFLYHPPEPGYDYSIGVRTSNGIGDDPTAIAVCRRARNEQEQDIQAAEFRDLGVSHVEAFAWAMAIAAHYAKFMTPEHGMNRHREPYVAIEQIMSVGDTCQLQMAKMGYSRFHRMTRYDSNPQDMMKSKAKKRGWYSNSWSTPMITDGFVVLVQNGWYKVNSPYTIYEMDHWEMHSTSGGKDKYLPSEDATAHGLYANALAAWCVNDMMPLAQRTAKRFMQTSGRPKKPVLDLTPVPSGITVPLSPLPMPSHHRLTRLRG